jgi:mutator protein MutT
MVGCGFLPLDHENGRILISRRAAGKRSYPGLWEILGGNLESGESLDDCVRREVQEEVGLAISALDQVETRAAWVDGALFLNVVYAGEVEGEPTPDPAEVAEVRWVRERDLDDLVFCPGDREALTLGFRLLGAKGRL